MNEVNDDCKVVDFSILKKAGGFTHATHGTAHAHTLLIPIENGNKKP